MLYYQLRNRAGYADMAELADALDSGSSEFTLMQVQVLLSAPNQTPSIDKLCLSDRWCLFCPKVPYLSRFRALYFCLVAIIGVLELPFSEDT